MKPKRVILLFEQEYEQAVTKLVLQTNRYHVVTCATDEERAEIMQRSWIDLLIVGRKAQTDYAGDVPIVRMAECSHVGSVMDMLERIRIAIVRKRGPKITGASVQDGAIKVAIPIPARRYNASRKEIALAAKQSTRLARNTSPLASVAFRATRLITSVTSVTTPRPGPASVRRVTYEEAMARK